jgi:hypothetical protein
MSARDDAPTSWRGSVLRWAATAALPVALATHRLRSAQ